MKYEYLLHVWGGFWNPLNIEKHGDDDVPYRWFDTKEERQAEIDRLESLRKALGTWDAAIAMNKTEGYLTRFQFVLHSIVNENGKLITVENNLGYGFWSDADLDEIGREADYMKEWKWDVSYDGDGERLYTTLILRL